ncbi:MAG: HAD-IA family hydrolase [Candidatus Bathyarchaeia archaeon]
MAIKAVLFDLGGTLVKTASTLTIFNRILAKHGVQVQTTVDEKIFNEVFQEMSEKYWMEYEKFWQTYNIRILRKLGIQSNLEELADIIDKEWWTHAELSLYPDVKDTILMLRRKGLKLGIVSNGLRKDIKEILLRVSLTGKFDVTVGVDDAGASKPDKRIFQRALNELTVSPNEAIFVGDNLEADYKGAENAGLKPLLIDRGNKVLGNLNKIHCLKEVMQYL